MSAKSSISRSPSLRPSIGGDAVVRAALPTWQTPFVGRARDLAAVLALFRDSGVRLLTLTGPGGVGKTRLAIAVAEDLRERFGGRTFFVSLGAITEPMLVWPMIAQALGVREEGGPAQEWLATSEGTAGVLILDNFEHLMAAAPAVAALAGAQRALTVLITSRSPLRLSGEQEFPVQPLALPDADRHYTLTELAANDAVSLFVQRARSVRREFALNDDNAAAVIDLCRRLDGLPLAIELAAARSKVMSPDAMLARFRHRFRLLSDGPIDAPPRQQTMHATIDWSYGLLDAAEQELFRALCVFSGDFGLDAAEAVVGGWGLGAGSWGDDFALLAPSPFPNPEPPAPNLLDGIASLVDKSFVQPAGLANGDAAPRFALLETVRAFGWEQLIASGEEDNRRERHARYFLAMAEHAACAPFPDDFWPSIEQLALERDNLRAALAWFEQRADHERGLQLAGALARFWYLQSQRAEGHGYLERFLANAPAGVPAMRARALFGLGILTSGLNADERAISPLRDSLALYRAADDDSGTAEALFMLGVRLENRGDYHEALALLEEAEAIFVRLGRPSWAALAHHHRGVCAFGLGNIEEAAGMLRHAVDRQRALTGGGQRTPWLASALNDFGVVLQSLGDRDRAVAAHVESLARWRDSRTLEGVADALANLATAFATTRPERAARLFGAADRLAGAVGYPFELPERALHERAKEGIRGTQGDAAFEAAWTAGGELSLEEAIAEGSRVEPPAPVKSATITTHVSALLTDRERDVMSLLIAGKTNRQIADELFISPRTAQAHVAAILEKLEAPTRAVAVAIALRDAPANPR